jgi:tRNA (guanine37-N1)-methyltransferase
LISFIVGTIFPELFTRFVDTGLIGKAIERGIISFEIMDPRDFTSDRHRSVDDAPYGGGFGMVMKAGPILEMMDALSDTHKIILTPSGRPFTQDTASRLSGLDRIFLLAGRYEGIDARVLPEFDEEISLGDFVLNGGEVAAMAIVEAVSRLVPGVLGNEMSISEESFAGGLLEYPQYTRPGTVRGRPVPDVLLTGDHGRVADWRRGQSLLVTRRRRPDLFEKLCLDEKDEQLLAEAEEATTAGGKTDKRR